MNDQPKDWVLIAWILALALWDFAVWGTCAYVVFFKGHSGWWFVLAAVITSEFTIYDVLKKRYGLDE
jgi:hypothetical protein